MGSAIKEAKPGEERTAQAVPNISAAAVLKYLEKQGFRLSFDFRDAKLGCFGHDALPLMIHDPYTVTIACCADETHSWICFASETIPVDAKYIIQCLPRKNIVNLWHLHSS